MLNDDDLAYGFVDLDADDPHEEAIMAQELARMKDAFGAVREGVARLAMIPVDNTLAGRVADVHHFLPKSGLSIIGEHFLKIEHALLGVKGSVIGDLKHVHSHLHALPQCRKLIKELGLVPHVHADTAGAASEVAERGEKSHAAIASTLAAEIYGLEILRADVQDAAHDEQDEHAGTGYHRDLDAMIAGAELGEVVQLLGSVTQETVRDELQSADGFVLASRHEPLGVAYMEAMACELPVIGTDAGGVRELITQGKDGLLVPPGNAEVLADAMLRLMEDHGLRHALGAAARQRVVADFSSRRSADALATALAGGKA